jgi:hypothetical protein
MKIAFGLCLLSILFVPITWGQNRSDYLTPEEIRNALQGTSKQGHARMIDLQTAIFTEANRLAQTPQLDIYMPQNWLALQGQIARQQYKQYVPSSDDALRAVTVVAYGGVFSGGAPTCDSITRVILLSDKNGAVVVEATKAATFDTAWQNGFGARASCSSLIAKFAMDDVGRVASAAAKREFFIGVFAGAGLSKMYKVKAQYLKELGLLELNGSDSGPVASTSVAATGESNNSVAASASIGVASGTSAERVRIAHEESGAGWIGVTTKDDSVKGLVITRVLAGSTAEQAGLRVGDVIEEMDGVAQKSGMIFDVAIAHSKPGSQIRISYMRGAWTSEATLTVGKIG